MSDKPKISLTKYMSREHSIFYAHVWNEANRDRFDEHVKGTNIKTMLFQLNKLGVLDVYYDLVELEEVFKRITDEINKKPEILDGVISEFYEYWKKLLPYVSDGKRIKSVEELREYYNSWMRWWSPMAYIFIVPDREKAHQALKEKALKVRELTQEYSDEGDKIFKNYIKDFYPQYEDIFQLFTPDEVYKLEYLTESEICKIRSRANGSAILTVNGRSSLLSVTELGKVLSDNKISIQNHKKNNVTEVRGVTASKGKVRGPIKVILTKADLNAVKAGDIMVTYATSPDYVVAMKKCAAIVTDEGGVVCHAAIVSRELGIPCIVGTKNATQVLKDGDMVEVDADRGIVKIIL